jgi:hypothetical protein
VLHGEDEASSGSDMVDLCVLVDADDLALIFLPLCSLQARRARLVLEQKADYGCGLPATLISLRRRMERIASAVCGS